MGPKFDEIRYLYLFRSEFTDPEQEAEWNAWYDHHTTELLTVPGFLGATRYAERGASGRYLAAYALQSMDVFNEPRYREVTGWGRWEPLIGDCDRAIFTLHQGLPDVRRPTG